MSTAAPTPDSASFRDPAGRVYHDGARILRSVTQAGAGAFNAAWQQGVPQAMAQQGRMIEAALLPRTDAAWQHFGAEVAQLLQHPVLPCITYPYEWPFAALKSAALAHLGLHLALLEKNFTLSDATAFNMQFVGTTPLHIDTLSIVPYTAGMHWAAHRQFLQHFLNPLLLASASGVAFQPLWRATLDGVTSADCAKLLPLRAWLRPSLWLHVAAPARAESSATSAPASQPLPPLPRVRMVGLLRHLQGLVSSLSPRITASQWQSYAPQESYTAQERQAKQAAVREFIGLHRPRQLLDVGSNTGEYALIALAAGAASVIGLESDPIAANAAFETAAHSRQPYLPLVADICNLSPSQGWQGTERPALSARLHGCDALLALAVVHHLALSRGIPLAAIMAQCVALAPRGLIEFVPKTDPQAASLLRHRPDIFPHYSLPHAKEALSRCARITAETPLGASGRVLLAYERTP